VKRLVQPELLDTLPSADPRAIRSRRDLRRINWWMRNSHIMAAALNDNSLAPAGQIIELGAGDGTFLLQVAKRIAPRHPKIVATLLDQQNNLAPETLQAFAILGWTAKTVVTDVFDWSPDTADKIIVANLFLHHFENQRLTALLQKISQSCNLFIAIEPHRFARPLLVGQLLWLIGCNEVTRHDAVVSIRAGFAGTELSALWPDKTGWHLTERRVGPFSHLFIARRRE
jgi:hypothetical protein